MLSAVKKYRCASLLNDSFHIYFRGLVGNLLIIAAVFLKFAGALGQSARLLMKANRIGYSANSIELFKRYSYLRKEILSPMVTSGVSAEEAARRSIVIRWPQYEAGVIVSKGILIVTFTHVFSFYLREIDIGRLSMHFYVVLEPSWSGYFDPDILCWALETKDPVFVESTELLDLTSINALTSNLVTLSIGASNWVDYKTFDVAPSEKIFDSVYVANTNYMKRITRYMKAVKNICKDKDPNYRGCLVCAAWGGNIDVIKALPACYGIEKNLKLMFSLKKEQVNEVINSSKVNLLLSFKEGSNRSLFESMFSGVPGICLAENIGVNKSYINEHTGLLIPDKFLEDGLLHMKQHWRNYRARQWALENISPESTTDKLVSVINSWAGEAESGEVFVKTNNPEVSYFHYPDMEFRDLNMRIFEIFAMNEEVNDVARSVVACREKFIKRISSHYSH